MRGERLRSTLLIQNVVRRAKSKEQNQNTQIVMVFEETAPSAAAADSCHDLNECGHAIIINLKNHLLTLRDIKKKKQQQTTSTKQSYEQMDSVSDFGGLNHCNFCRLTLKNKTKRL